MTLPVLAIRPEPGLSGTLNAGRERGLPMHGFALFAVEPLAWDVPEPTEFDAILAGSANVFRHGGDGMERLKSLPVLAVGEVTAQAARDKEFSVQAVGKGGLQSLLDAHRDTKAHWLRLAGEEHVPLDVPQALKLTTRVIYRVKAAEIPHEMQEIMRRDCAVLLHSAAAARHFANCVDGLNLDRSNIALAAIGPRVLEPAGKGWKASRSASTPSEDALLALAKDMCETI